MISSVMPTSVMPDNGDQLVRPIASESMMPDIHIQRVPSSAMAMPRTRPTDSTEVIAMILRRIAAPTIAKYSSLIGISSPDAPVWTFDAFCIDLMALTISGEREDDAHDRTADQHADTEWSIQLRRNGPGVLMTFACFVERKRSGRRQHR